MAPENVDAFVPQYLKRVEAEENWLKDNEIKMIVTTLSESNMKTVEEQAKIFISFWKWFYGTSPWTLEQVLIDIRRDQTDYFLLYDHDKLLGF